MRACCRSPCAAWANSLQLGDAMLSGNLQLSALSIDATCRLVTVAHALVATKATPAEA
jgi:hypothetical protein